MRCERVRRWLVTEAGAVWGREPRAVRRHLARCPVCRERAARAVREADLLRRVLGRLPVRAGFVRGVLERIRGQTPMP